MKKRLFAVFALVCAMLFTCVGCDFLDELFGLGNHETVDPSDEGDTGDKGGTGDEGDTGGTEGSDGGGETGSGAVISEGDLSEITSAGLSVHFLELGVSNAGDCVLIKCGDTEVLIDAGAKSASAPTQVMLDYVASYCTDGVLEYVIATHAHEDHIAGLAGQTDPATGLGRGFLYQYEIGTIVQFPKHNTTSQVYGRYEAAVNYCAEQGTNVYTALECVNEENGAQSVFYLDEAQTVSMKILYQKYYETYNSSENNYSVCMLLSQTVDEETAYHYLFTGDLEKAGEESLVASNPDLPHCVLFKGGHHGSSTSSNEVLLEKITPDNIAICTCAGTYEYADKPTEENPDTYLRTFPTQEAIDRMALYTANIYVTSLGILNDDYSTKGFTSMNGNIVFYYGKSEEEEERSLKLWCSNNTIILKETEWFLANRTWPENGV